LQLRGAMSELDPQNSGKDTESDKEIDSLSADEMAAFEKIMAEIAAATGNPSKDQAESLQTANAKPSVQSDEPDGASLTDETDGVGKNVDLDQIMAEIATKRAPSTAAESKQEEADLSGDQQAALDQIMAEIENKRHGEKKESASTSTANKAESDLSNDQQAALDQIMAEIESKRSAGKNAPIESTLQDEDGPTESLELDVEKIMSEVESREIRKKPSDNATVVKKEDVKANAGDKAVREPENLSLEEFDEELNLLLNSAAEVVTPTQEVVTPTKKAQPKIEIAARQVYPEEKPDYAILQEVQAVSDKKKPAGMFGLHLRMRTLAVGALILAIFIFIPIGGYFAYLHLFSSSLSQPDHMPVIAETKQIVIEAPIEDVLPAASAIIPSQPLFRPIRELEVPAAVLAGLKSDLSDARNRIQHKIYDIEQLKSFYLRGVNEEAEKIEEALEGGRIPSYQEALSNKKIELPLRAIQRRRIYAAKLQAPLNELQSIFEELLYLERQTHVYEILNNGIAGLPIDLFRKEVSEVIDRHLENYSQLSIDDVDIQTPGLSAVWAELASGFEQKANLLAQRAPLNRAIGAEICKGKYERASLLTAMSAETANCLVKWPGKDMFLNGITELTPAEARILSRWQGEWLSLNGVKELSPEAAENLSQWQGRRLSLNGLVALSPAATEHLSRWKGSQLEMVGLRSIGSWRNYGTRLFLSKELQRQLEMQ